MGCRRRGEEGLSIPEVLIAGFVIALSVAMTMASVSALSRGAVKARYAERSQEAAQRILETMRAFGCGLMTGNEDAAKLSNLRSNCFGVLGDSTSPIPDPTDGALTFRFTIRWVNPAVSSSDCAGQQARTPTLLERTVIITAPNAAGGTTTRRYRQREATPLDAAGYNLSGRGGIVVADTGTVTLRPPGTSGGSDIVHVGGPCAWFPFLVPGTYTVTKTSGATTVNVTAPGQTLL